MSHYRTKTYIAGDWDGDKDLIDKLYEWNDRDSLDLSFSDAHKEKQARDTSLNCDIKKSLSDRLDISKTFLLVVGAKTITLTSGSCKHCGSYDAYHGKCARGYSLSMKSYIQFECDKADRDGLNIIVVYNYAHVDKSKCPEVLRNKGDHINGRYIGEDGITYWNYQAIKKAILKY